MSPRKIKKNVIVDYKSITEDQLQLLNDNYPHGVDDDDLTHYLNSKGETVDAIPLETEDTRYLFKVSVHLDKKIAQFNLDQDDEDNDEGLEEEDIEIDEELDD
jgi:hypothetical protein